MSRVRLVPGTAAKELALLGRAHAVDLEDWGETRFRGADFRGGDAGGWWLAADPAGGCLLIGSDSLVSETSKHPQKRFGTGAASLRERFTGRKVDGRKWALPVLPAMWEDMGPALSILYESDKINGGGTGRPELFRHEFSHGAKAYRAGDFLAIVGTRIKVDAAGIRN